MAELKKGSWTHIKCYAYAFQLKNGDGGFDYKLSTATFSSEDEMKHYEGSLRDAGALHIMREYRFEFDPACMFNLEEVTFEEEKEDETLGE